jgi:hypothetical protein
MTRFLYRDLLWKEITKKARKARHIRAAIRPIRTGLLVVISWWIHAHKNRSEHGPSKPSNVERSASIRDFVEPNLNRLGLIH